MGFQEIITVSKVEQEFVEWFNAERRNGLVSIRFSTARSFMQEPLASQATPESFMQELMDIDRAIAEKRYSPFPSDW